MNVRLGRGRLLAILAIIALSACARTPTTSPGSSAVPSMGSTRVEPATQSPPASEHSDAKTLEPSSRQSLAEGWVELARLGDANTIEAVLDVVEAPFGILAAGVHYPTRSLGVFDPLTGDGRIWLSEDGVTWTDVTPADTFIDASIGQLVALADGAVLALGWASHFVDGSLEEIRPTVWETRDGRVWAELGLSVGGDPVIEIAHGGGGYLARVGSELGGQQLGFSTDGRTFEPVADPTGSRIVTQTAAGPEGFVIRAEVYEGAEPATLYASGDGHDWYEAVTTGWQPGDLAPIGPDWVAVDQRAFETQDDTEVLTRVSANGLEWAEAGRLPLRTIDVGGGAVCGEIPELVSTGTLVVASTTLSYPCGEGLVQRFGAVHVTDDGGAWFALPFAAATEIDDPRSRGTRVSAGLDLTSGTLLVGETQYRAVFWFRPFE